MIPLSLTAVQELSVRPDIRLGVIPTGHSPNPAPVLPEPCIPPPTTIQLDYTSPFICQVELSLLLSQQQQWVNPPSSTASNSPLVVDDLQKIDVGGGEEEEVDQSHLTRVQVGFEEEVEEENQGEEEMGELAADSEKVEEEEEEILGQIEEAADTLRESIERSSNRLANVRSRPGNVFISSSITLHLSSHSSTRMTRGRQS